MSPPAITKVRLAQLEDGARRYEAIRKLSLRQYCELYWHCHTTAARFDDMVDAIARGDYKPSNGTFEPKLSTPSRGSTRV